MEEIETDLVIESEEKDLLLEKTLGAFDIGRKQVLRCLEQAIKLIDFFAKYRDKDLVCAVCKDLECLISTIKTILKDIDLLEVNLRKASASEVINYEKHIYFAEVQSCDIESMLKSKMELLRFSEKLYKIQYGCQFLESFKEQQEKKMSAKKSSKEIVVKEFTPKEVVLPSMLKRNCLKAGLEITQKNYFNQGVRPFLHFFSGSSNSEQTKIIFVYLPEKEDDMCMMEKRKLEIKYQLPHWHGTLATPQGSIYFFGGAYSITGTKFRDSYIYDPETSTLVPKAPMLVDRDVFSVCFISGKIYVVGGRNSDIKYIKECERYDISKNEWEKISPTITEAGQASICNFKNKYIYKFGGWIRRYVLNNCIERYDIAHDKWELLFDFRAKLENSNMNSGFNIPSCGISSLVNENEIICFGGWFEELTDLTNQTFVLSVDDQGEKDSPKERICLVNKSVLCSRAGFWEQNYVILNKKLYCLHCIEDNLSKGSFYIQYRNLLRFDPFGWDLVDVVQNNNVM